uniref:butyrate kinase n=1 Tax=Alistipes sp. TaxID=1872444 RepID=UPI004055A8BC
MAFQILAINPGSTSTKAALFEDNKPVLELTLRHSVEEIGRFASISDQLEWRRDLILAALEEKGYKIEQLSAVIGRGGLIKPIEGGVYEVNETLKHDLLHAERHHASNLGGLIADEIARAAGVKAYIADPVVVDEMIPEARYTGLPECPRASIFHALNQKATARIYAKQVGKRYEDLNLIVAHMGGGISVSAHRQGRVIDTNNALTGEGPFSPERAGSLPADALLDLAFSGNYTKSELLRKIAGKGGLVAHLGTSSVQEICEVRIEKENDEKSRNVMEAMCFNIAKSIGGMAAILCGKVDAIILTGGIAYNDYVNVRVKEACEFIAPVHIYPGENELEALASNALMVLTGEITPKNYC